MARRTFGNRKFGFALYEGGEAGGILGLPNQPTRAMARRAADITWPHFDTAFVDRRRAQKIDCQSPEMGEII